MANGKAHIAALDAFAEQLAGRRVCEANNAPLNDQCRLVDGVDQGANSGICFRHVAIPSRLMRESHIRETSGPLVAATRGPPFEPKGRGTERPRYASS